MASSTLGKYSQYILLNKNKLNTASFKKTLCDKYLLNHKTLIRCFASQENYYDITIVGGGIVGMATARELSKRHTGLRIAVVEKEHKVAYHQSGHNSGVIHAGVYYKPGTLKAKLCVKGMDMAYRYFEERNVPNKKCGKLIVATNDVEVKNLDDLFERGLKNNVRDLAMIDGKDICKIEPNCQGKKAIHSPHTGIVDWALVTEKFAEDFITNGGKIYLNYEVIGFESSSEQNCNMANEYPVVVKGKEQAIQSKFVLTCGGLHSDILSEMSGCSAHPRIVPFRGEYLLLKSDKANLVRGNIYPVPDPRFPFLGVHFTPRMDGSVWLGPNAVLALKREGYSWTDFNLPELWDTLKYSGFRKLALKYLAYGTQEMLKSMMITRQVRDLQRFIPQVTRADVVRGPAGVRAQALDPSGELVDDFVFDIGRHSVGKRILHCRNAPSPGATSSLAIAELVADKIEQEFKLQ